jgi:hypothetical protein
MGKSMFSSSGTNDNALHLVTLVLVALTENLVSVSVLLSFTTAN